MRKTILNEGMAGPILAVSRKRGHFYFAHKGDISTLPRQSQSTCLTMPALFTTIRSCRFIYGFGSPLDWHFLTASIVGDTHPLATRAIGWTPCGHSPFRPIKESLFQHQHLHCDSRCRRSRRRPQLANCRSFEAL